MSTQRYTPEFKAEAARQVVEHKPVSASDQDNDRLLKLIRGSFAASQGVYGALHVYGVLAPSTRSVCWCIPIKAFFQQFEERAYP
ncbi:hypothetical protein [Pseudomonas sp.]|uniref:hypothetical protein n=1 Tax=Pseudomonas sp. TaxID=306 RepID=UPI003BB2032B